MLIYILIGVVAFVIGWYASKIAFTCISTGWYRVINKELYGNSTIYYFANSFYFSEFKVVVGYHQFSELIILTEEGKLLKTIALPKGLEFLDSFKQNGNQLFLLANKGSQLLIIKITLTSKDSYELSEYLLPYSNHKIESIVEVFKCEYVILRAKEVVVSKVINNQEIGIKSKQELTLNYELFSHHLLLKYSCKENIISPYSILSAK